MNDWWDWPKMVVYLAVAFFPFVVFSVPTGNQTTKSIKLLKIIIAALPMFLLIALRDSSLGADTGMYIREFEQMIDTPWEKIFYNTREEHGFRIFVKLLTYITHSPQLYQIIYTLIYFIAIVSFANHLDFETPWFLFLFATIGIYTFMFTGVRQCLAMSICLFSYQFIKKRKLLPFLLCVALAFTFHKSSALFLFAYFIYGQKMHIINIILYIFIAVIAMVYLDAIQEFFNEQFEYKYTIEQTGNGGIYFAFLFGVTALATVITLLEKKFNKEATGLFNVGVVAIICWFLRLFTRIAERPSFYFLFFSCAFIAYAISSVKDAKQRQIIKIVLFMLCTLYYIYRFMTSLSTLVPYLFYF